MAFWNIGIDICGYCNVLLPVDHFPSWYIHIVLILETRIFISWLINVFNKLKRKPQTTLCIFDFLANLSKGFRWKKMTSSTFFVNFYVCQILWNLDLSKTHGTILVFFPYILIMSYAIQVTVNVLLPHVWF